MVGDVVDVDEVGKKTYVPLGFIIVLIKSLGSFLRFIKIKLVFVMGVVECP